MQRQRLGGCTLRGAGPAAGGGLAGWWRFSTAPSHLLTRAKGTSLMISSVAPLLEKQTSRSAREMMPISPCSASWGLRKTALVPVDTSVWQIFCAISPLLPTPVKITTPVHSRQACGGAGAGRVGRASRDAKEAPARRCSTHLAELSNGLKVQVIEEVVDETGGRAGGSAGRA